MKNNYILKNHRFLVSEGNSEMKATLVVYEVIRIIQGVPLFFNEHVTRLKKSLSLCNKILEIDIQSLHQNIKLLSEKNQTFEGNILLKIVFNDDEHELEAKFIDHKYPSLNEYEKGVNLGILSIERNNPKAKVVNMTVRELADAKISETGVYEVLLIDSENNIREGSRSNFFAIKNGALYSAPLNKVLKGITLEKILQIADNEKIPVYFENISIDNIETIDAAFITGTSPKILPVNSIGKTHFDVDNSTLRFMMKAFDGLLEKDIQQKRDAE